MTEQQEETSVESPPKTYEIREGLFTNEEQTKAVDFLLEFILNSPEKEAVLIGKGGTGKTTSIKVVVDKLRTMKKINANGRVSDYVIAAAAPSHNACNKLSYCLDHEVNVYTIAAILGMKLDIYSGKFQIDEFARREKGVPIELCDVIVFDEGSMIGERLRGWIRQFAPKDAKIIYMGDYRQLPPIREKGENKVMEADSPIFDLSLKVEIHKRMRQAEDSPIIPIIDFVGNCIETNKFFRIPIADRISKKIGESEVIFSKDAEWMLNSYCEDFKESPHDVYNAKCIAYTNDYRVRLNNAIRKRLFGEEEAKNQFVIGEVITAFDTYFIDTMSSIKNSESFVVEAIKQSHINYQWTEMTDGEGNFIMKPKLMDVRINVVLLDIILEDEFHSNIPVVAASDIDKFKETLNHLFEKRLFHEAYAFKEQFADLQYGYAITSHKAQAQTYKNVYVLEDDIMGLANVKPVTKFKSFYVAVSRPSKKLVIFSRIT